jgi:hypothetical protein
MRFEFLLAAVAVAGIYVCATIIWGNRAERTYEELAKSPFRFLYLRGKGANREAYVRSQKRRAWVVLIALSIALVVSFGKFLQWYR